MKTANQLTANTHSNGPSSFRFIGITALVVLLCLSLSSVAVYKYSRSEAQRLTQSQMSVVKKQAGIILQPLILTGDTVSMNVQLSALTQASYINGLELSDPRGKTLARAGSGIGNSEQLIIYNQQIALATLKFYYSSQSINAFYNPLLYFAFILSFFSCLCILITATTLSRRDLRLLNQKYKPLLKHQFSLELAQAEPHTHPTETNPSANEAVSLAIVDIKEPSVKAPSDNDKNTENSDTSTAKTVEKSDELVALLKPDNTQRMPHFTPVANKPDTQAEEEVTAVRLTQPTPAPKQTLEIELDETAPADSPAPSMAENPLRRASSHEEQLDLYTLEHQLEISLKAEDAAYLLFIDCSSGRAPIEDHEEHSQLLTQYRKLVTQVTKIYGGHIELLANGDIRVLFDQGDALDNHGTQALCAAKLFNQLYKYYNQRQITRMQPTLNVQTSLVRGNKDKMELLREEAHFLTCTTLSNELISHTPLSEISALKDTLLEEAKTQRHDEDKILILSLNPAYQDLLEQQARHLVKGI